jgi:hypothetical protein
MFTTVLYAVAVALLGLSRAGMWIYASQSKRLVSATRRPPEGVVGELLWNLSAPFLFLASIPVAMVSPFAAQLSWLVAAAFPLLAYLTSHRRRLRGLRGPEAAPSVRPHTTLEEARPPLSAESPE